MNNEELFKLLAIISPIFSGIIAATLTNLLSNRSKRLDILYQHRIPAFKEIHKILVDYKSHVEESLTQSEFIGYDDAKGAVETITMLKNSFEINGIYFNSKTRKSIIDMIDHLTHICNLQILVLQNDIKEGDLLDEDTITRINKLIETLYKDLHLK